MSGTGDEVPGDTRLADSAADLPSRVRQTIEWYAAKHGTVDGYLLRHPSDPSRTFPHYHIANQWQRIKQAGQVDIPRRDGRLRHAALLRLQLPHSQHPHHRRRRVDGHKTIEITFKIYRHLMPGSLSKAAKILNLNLAA